MTTAWTQAEQGRLWHLARDTVAHGCAYGRLLPVDLEDWPDALRQPRATFVTLKKHHALRGCIGTLEASRPLVADIAHNAFAAAFHDPRFPPVQPDEIPDLDVSISVLAPPLPLTARNEEEVLRQLRPGVDGLILEAPCGRATFLPAVWEECPEPRRFLRHLKQKAGWPGGHWPDNARAWRYTVDRITRPTPLPDAG